MDATKHLAPGSVFASAYRVIEYLGDGEMGATYEVEPVSGGARCALKVMNAALATSDAWRASFVTGAKGTSQVASAGLLQTLDAGIDAASGRPWFTTELLRGEDLSTRVARDGPRPMTELRALVDALGDALGKAHAKGLVHYDLTPENVHLGPGVPFSVQLRELTISRLVADACAAEGDLIGSVLWMAPEQFDIGRTLTARANVWSLGLLAFYAATGHSYWTTASNDPAPSKELLRQILSDPLVPVSQRAKELGCADALPPRLDAWFARCIVRDVRDRFPDALSARATFAELVDQPADEAEDDRPTLPLPERRTPPRRRRSVSQADIAEILSQTLPSPDVTPAAPPSPDLTPPISPTPPPAATAVRPAGAKRAQTRAPGRALRYVAMAAVVMALAFWLKAERGPGSALTVATPPSGSPPAPTDGTATAAASGLPATPMDRTATAATSATAAMSATPMTSATAVTSTPAATASATAAPSGARGVMLFANAADGAQGPATEASEEASDYDLAAALKALNRVYYGDCRVPSAGQIAVTFAASGHVKKVAIVQGDYDDHTFGCIAARFGAANMPPFRGAPQTVTASLQSSP